MSASGLTRDIAFVQDSYGQPHSIRDINLVVAAALYHLLEQLEKAGVMV